MRRFAGPEDFVAAFDVSRETLDRLTLLHDLVLRWNRRINLVARGGEADLWSRHLADSAQLWRLRPPAVRRWADLGAGAGFPGLVVAALAAADAPGAQIDLVESDARKAVFLSEAARILELAATVTVHAARAEALAPLGADVVSARALAPLERLLDLALRHRAPDGVGLFPKGASVHKEIEAAAVRWRFEHELHRSVTDPDAAIVEVGAASRA